ncbi:hypothetical protein [Salipaludibacillus daqingensis]|uniref:hypothetical protein n=1 Tax=Salipaludibacillus daqingensis TaxID=3041001 RepID=UPI0024758432|nr:hypothetical protein [Salipaludibacillus daqingensis]
MEVKFKRNLTPTEKEKIRQYVGFYRGIAVFKNSNSLEVIPKKKFSEDELFETLKSLDVPIENAVVTI